ncbi:MAG TPA: hypothetical protein PLH72_12900, partial [Vicinamibacterales bacterium]|nr:hypothetical protein [Vicinamibacterales bacterium]
LVDAWRPGAFAMAAFGVPGAECRVPGASAECRVRVPSALRRFRLPVPVRVRVEEGRPVRLTTDRHGLTGGVIVQAAGPWRTSGEWWASEPSQPPSPQPLPPGMGPARLSSRDMAWDRDEWDIAMADGTVYRLFVERPVGQWYLEGMVD